MINWNMIRKAIKINDNGNLAYHKSLRYELNPEVFEDIMVFTESNIEWCESEKCNIINWDKVKKECEEYWSN